MDTKSKSKHKIAIFCILFTILLPAAAMIKLYPFFATEANTYKETFYEGETFLTQLIHGNYILYAEEAQRKAQKSLSPDEMFLPEFHNTPTTEAGRKEEMQEVSSALYRTYEQWGYSFNNLRASIEYQILDANNKVVSQNTPSFSLEEALKNDNNDNYAFGVIMNYDSIGSINISDVYGENPQVIQDTLDSLGRVNPMSNIFGSYEDLSSVTTLKFQMPQNYTFVYAMTRDSAAHYLATKGNWEYRAYMMSGAVPEVAAAFMLVVALIAIFLPFIKPLRTGDEAVFHAPLELVLLLLVLLAGLMAPGFSKLVLGTNEGRILDILQQTGLPVSTTYLIQYLWNLFWWSTLFASAYWAISCLRAIFTLKPARYIRERTLIYQIYPWAKGIAQNIYHSLEEITLHKKSSKIILKVVAINFIVLTVICVFWFFGIPALVIYSVLLFLFLQKYYKDLRDKYMQLLDATNQIAKGHFDISLTDYLGVFEPLKEVIETIQSGFKTAVEKEVQSQRMKTDLITNVSHDLKTPLTAIITYVNLLKEDSLTAEQRTAYIAVLEQKSLHLKTLIEDLFEISKATSKDVTLNLMEVDITALLKQVLLELSDKMDASSLDFRIALPDEKIILSLDSQKTYRIFENLLINILNYSLPHTRVYVNMLLEEDAVVITLKNISACELTLNPSDITERFVRGDSARNTEGSGLGLAIAKSFTELQKGNLDVNVEADLFRVALRFPLNKAEEPVLPTPVDTAELFDVPTH